MLMNLLQLTQFPDRPAGPSVNHGPIIALIHGLLGRSYMRNHLLRFLREEVNADATMFGYLHSESHIADELEEASLHRREIVIIGYSLGGFQAVKIARELERRSVPVGFLVTIGSGGPGRLAPIQWNVNNRQIPTNVAVCVNFFSEADVLGTDRRYQDNLAIATSANQRVENYEFPRIENISHMGLTRCYPKSSVHPMVRSKILERIRRDLMHYETHEE
jgi:pimeloyl-ACP methyl ester carboxylesterase